MSLKGFLLVLCIIRRDERKKHEFYIFSLWYKYIQHIKSERTKINYKLVWQRLFYRQNNVARSQNQLKFFSADFVSQIQ